MNSKLILSVLKIGATILFYLLSLITIGVTAKYISKLVAEGEDRFIQVENSNTGFIDLNANATSLTYSGDAILRYKQINRLYSVELDPASVTGYYYMGSTLLFLALGLIVLWNFKMLFTEIKLLNPFQHYAVKRLKLLAAVFIISDILGSIHYFVLEALIHHSVASPRLKLVTESGTGILIGLIMIIIAVIYQRAVEINEENRLTV